jgi:hypothetical protein
MQQTTTLFTRYLQLSDTVEPSDTVEQTARIKGTGVCRGWKYSASEWKLCGRCVDKYVKMVDTEGMRCGLFKFIPRKNWLANRPRYESRYLWRGAKLIRVQVQWHTATGQLGQGPQYAYPSSSSSLAWQPYVGPGLPQKLLPAEVSGYCFFRFRDKSFPRWRCQPHVQPPAILEGQCFLSG